MSAEDIEYISDYKEFPTKESALDWLDNYLSLDERNNLIRALQQEPTYTSKVAQKAYEDGKKDGYVKAKVEQILESNDNVLDKIREEREEAIEFGNMWLQMNEDCKDSSTYAFFQMAIKALEQEPILDKIRAEIEASRWTDKDMRIEKNALASGLDKALEIINKYRLENENEKEPDTEPDLEMD